MEQFVYTRAHLDALKKYKTSKVIMLLLACLVLLLQSIAWIIVWVREMPVKTSDMWFVGITLICSLYFVMSQVFSIIHNNVITKGVKLNGEYKALRLRIKFSDKTSWSGAMAWFYRIMVVVFVCLLGVLIVNFVQNYVNWGKVILKAPLVIFLAVGFLNTSAEFRYQAMIERV